MHAATTRAKARPSSDLGHYYLCEELEKGLRVYLHPSVVDRLQLEAAKGLSRAEQRAEEMAGVLLGRVEAGPGLTVLVENFHPLPAGEAEDLRWERALADRQAEPNAHQVVGFYRSHSGEYMALNEADLGRIHKHFADPSSVFLLIKPFGNGSCVAGLFFWEEGRVDPHFPAVEVPFGGTSDPLSRTRALRSEPAWQPEPRQAAAPRIPKPVATSESSRMQTQTSRLGLLRPAAWTAAALIALAVAAATVGPWVARRLSLRDSQAVTPAGATLGLQVVRKTDHLLLTWNRNALEVVSARRAVLLIRDGSQQKEFDIDAAQLRTGSIFYTPASGDVQFRLEVFVDDNRSLAESIRVLAPEALSTPTNSGGLPAQARGIQPFREQQHLGAPSRRGVLTLSSGDEQPERPPSAEREAAPRPKPFVHELPQPKSAEMPSLASPPQLETAPTSVASVLRPNAAMSGPPPAATPPSAPSVTRPASLNAAASVPAAQPKSSDIDFVAARILRRVAPTLTPAARSVILGLSGENIVQVRVLINTNGKVDEASLVRGSTTPHPVLAQAAMEAAKKFEFAPAQSNHHAVPSEMVLNFRFIR